MDNPYDVLILGGGPIGASTAYFLSKQEGMKVGVITQDADTLPHTAFKNAGGSIRTFWEDPLKVEMTQETTRFVEDLDAKGVDLSFLKDNYLFLNRGKFVPSVNVSGAKLVQHFLSDAQSRGVEVRSDETIQEVKESDEGCVVRTDKGEYHARKVLLALGAANGSFMPGLELEKEERYLMVLDAAVGEDEQRFPHVVIPIGEGVAYIFIKKMPEGLRFVVGQEEVLEIPKEEEIQEHFKELLDRGLGEALPFLKSAKVEKALFGTDVGNKTLKLENQGGIYSANCGSAIRACVWIGRTVAEALAR